MITDDGDFHLSCSFLVLIVPKHAESGGYCLSFLSRARQSTLTPALLLKQYSPRLSIHRGS